MPKSKNDIKTPQNMRMVLNHLIESCPKLMPILKLFVDHSHYEVKYGVTSKGERTRNLDDGDSDVIGDNDDGGVGLTIAASKRMAMKLIANLTSFSLVRLNLSTPEASQLKKLIADVVHQYIADFPPIPPSPQPMPQPPTADQADAAPLPGEASQSLVLLDEAELTPEEHGADLVRCEAPFEHHKKRALDNYIKMHAELVADGGSDVERRKRKLVALPVAGEKKWKLFIRDFMVAGGNTKKSTPDNSPNKWQPK